jgi:hypothetical protein
MGSFKPEQHLISLRKGGKPDYLETKWRLAWFRESDEHPNGSIMTEVLDKDAPLVKATVYDADGRVLASAHAGADDKGGNKVWSGRSIEKAETAAVGRALAMAGYGTQFVGDDLDDGVADSPATQPQGDRDRSRDKEHLNGSDQPNRVTTETNPAPKADTANLDDLRNKAVAEDFIKATRAAKIEDADVLTALGVAKLSEWTQGRKAAGQRVKAWQAEQHGPDLNAVYTQTAMYWNARKHFDNWLGQQYPDGVKGLDADELVAAIEADRAAQGKTAADKQFANI